MHPPACRTRVSLVDDHPLVVAGLSALLAPHPEVEVVDPADRGTTVRSVDLLLLDVAETRRRPADVPALAAATGAAVVAFCWEVDRTRIHRWLEAGVVASVWKGLPALDLVAAFATIGDRTRTRTPGARDRAPRTTPPVPDRHALLTQREQEVVELIAHGMSNQQIADACFLSVNSVKSYIRSAYRKMGVRTRSQAVLWGIHRGLDTTDPVLPPAPPEPGTRLTRSGPGTAPRYSQHVAAP